MRERTLGALARQARARLAEAGIADASLDARLLVSELAGLSPADLVARPDMPMSPEHVSRIEAAVDRRIAGEPVHRILGRREFYGLSLGLSPATLEPRPDTEALVDLVLPDIRRIAAEKGACRILDLGTGTGAIALAVLSQVPQARALASDISGEALATARDNAAALGLANRFETVESRWFEKIEGRFDAILSNPPYIRTDEIRMLDRGVRCFDPLAALDGGPDGLGAYRAIARGASEHLSAGGFVAVEIGYDQRLTAAAIFEPDGFRLEAQRKDLGWQDRALLFRK